jgi:hypothetical protein
VVLHDNQQRNRRSSGNVLNLQIILDWLIGAISPLAKSWTTNAGLAKGGQWLTVSQEIGRDVGEPDAVGTYATM